VGTDLCIRGDDAIVEGLTQLAADDASCLHVVHVVEAHKLIELPGAPELIKKERAVVDGTPLLRRRIQFDAVLNGVPYVAARIHTHVRVGHPIEEILQACVDFEADLLILGTHGRKGLQHLLIGSVTEQLVRQAHCPVLVARPKNYHGLPKSPPPSGPSSPSLETHQAWEHGNPAAGS